MKRIGIFSVVLFFFFCGGAFAKTAIELNSGQKVEGDLVEETAAYIRLDVSGVELTFYKDEIKGAEDGDRAKTPKAPVQTKEEIPSAGNDLERALTLKETYAAYQRAVQSSDIEALRQYVSSESMAELDAMENADTALNLMKQLSPKNVQLGEEKIDGDTAMLTAGAEGIFGATKGIISFIKEDGLWKIAKEDWKEGAAVENEVMENRAPEPVHDTAVEEESVYVPGADTSASFGKTVPRVEGIAIDGKAGDWSGIPVLIADPKGDVRESFMDEAAYEFDITDLKMALGEKDLYVLITFAQPILETCEKNGRQKPGEAHAKTVATIFVDADNNKATGGEEFFSKRGGFESKIEIWSGVAKEDGSMSVSGGAYMTDVESGAPLKYFLEIIPSRYNPAENELKTDFSQKMQSDETPEYVAFASNALEARIPFEKVGTLMKDAKALRVLLSESGSGMGEESFSEEVVAQIE
jgi:hypothetical protein